MPPPDPGDAGLVCHYCRCLSPHTYSCADCGREFCLQCVPTRSPAPEQTIRCPGCGSRKIQRQDPAQDSPPA
jgi:DNA-directed RNA polymerase subunit RPC12/RpoP